MLSIWIILTQNHGRVGRTEVTKLSTINKDEVLLEFGGPTRKLVRSLNEDEVKGQGVMVPAEVNGNAWQIVRQCGHFANPIGGQEDKFQLNFLRSQRWVGEPMSGTTLEFKAAMMDDMVVKQCKWRCQSMGLMFKYVLVHPITRGFSVPKTAILERSLSLNSPGLESNLNLLILNDLSFTLDHRPTLSWKFVFHEKQYD
jgi:hypothetical protein